MPPFPPNQWLIITPPKDRTAGPFLKSVPLMLLGGLPLTKGNYVKLNYLYPAINCFLSGGNIF